MDLLINKLIIYRKNIQNTILTDLSEIIRKFETTAYDEYELINEIYTQINRLLNLSAKYAFSKNLWHNYIAYILATSENSFTLLAEKNHKITIDMNQFIQNDYELFLKIFHYDFSKLEESLNINCFSLISNYNNPTNNERIQNVEVGLKVKKLCFDLESVKNIDDMHILLVDFYKKYGVGSFGLNKAFKLSPGKDKSIIPITSIDNVVLDDLVGYQVQKNKLIENTEAFVNGFEANNVLLYGDMGTGKSTSIKAILNQYYKDGLRIIELYKHEAKYLPEIISKIKNRNYRFIIYMDDLSFEESESEYKYLKALIEGGLETNPENVLIYATSNRRHLIKETWNERTNTSVDEELYKSDTVREKLSLVDRFGITIGYYKPSVKEYFNIVITLAKKYPELTYSEEELRSLANKWMMTHGGQSGRTAQQLITHLRAINR